MLNAIQMGIFTPSTKQRLEELEQQRKDLSLQIAKEELAQPTLTRDQILFWLYRFRELNPEKTEHRRRLINSFVNEVYLYDDYLVFVGNYKDGTKTISFAKLEAAGIGLDLNALSVPKKGERASALSSSLFAEEGTRTIKCDSPVDCLSCPAGRA